MVQQLNAKEVKEKILTFLNMVGPSLPVQVAKHMNMNSIFASAFLSEMSSDGMIKISDMKVGGSPLYYPLNKVSMLENFINSLNEKEREACLLLKEKEILADSDQQPAIRVALRGLKDFAFPFKKDDKIFWRYFLISEEEVRNRLEKTVIENKPEKIEKIKPIEEEKKTEQIAEKIIENQEEKNTELETINRELEEKKKELEKLKQELSIQKEKPEENIKISKKLKPNKKLKIEDEFLNELKPALEKKQIEIINLESFDKKQVFAVVKINGKECFLAAYNKRKIDDEDILKANKRALIKNLPYYLLSKGEASKKTKEAIEAHKKLVSMEKIE